MSFKFVPSTYNSRPSTDFQLSSNSQQSSKYLSTYNSLSPAHFAKKSAPLTGSSSLQPPPKIVKRVPDAKRIAFATKTSLSNNNAIANIAPINNDARESVAKTKLMPVLPPKKRISRRSQRKQKPDTLAEFRFEKQLNIIKKYYQKNQYKERWFYDEYIIEYELYQLLTSTDKKKYMEWRRQQPYVH